MIIIDIIVGLVIGALTGMGVGGAGLLVIYLTFFDKIDHVSAQGINLYFFIFASVGAMFVHYAKRNIDYKKVLLASVCGIPFSYLGAFLANSINPHLVKKAFGAMLILSGILILKSNFKKPEEK